MSSATEKKLVSLKRKIKGFETFEEHGLV